MAADLRPADDARRLRRTLVAAAAVAIVVLAAAAFLAMHEEAPAGGGLTIGEKLAALSAQRTTLQARADGEARIALLPAFRIAGLLTDALAVRVEPEHGRAFDLLPAFRRQAFTELEALNGALRDALDTPSDAARLGALQAARRAEGQLDRLAGDDAPLVLSYAPRFVPPRRSELTLTPGEPGTALQGAVPLDTSGSRASLPAASVDPAVPRYAPDFAAGGDDDPPVEIEIVGSHLSSAAAPPPVLSIGGWRGHPTISPERLRFSVPRSAFPTDARRTSFATATLSLQRGSRTVSFSLMFTVLPDRPGSFAFDQRVMTTTFESQTLVSPEILSRAPAGETRTVRRCFDPPPGWRFDKARMRVIIVERLGWLEDASDPALNGGFVELVPAEQPEQVCLAVVARPVVRSARTATIGRFEATLVRDKPVETVLKTGIRALDWREPVRVPVDPGMVEWKLYVRLFDDVDREFEGNAESDPPLGDTDFLHVGLEDGGRVVVLRADPSAEP